MFIHCTNAWPRSLEVLEGLALDGPVDFRPCTTSLGVTVSCRCMYGVSGTPIPIWLGVKNRWKNPPDIAVQRTYV